MDTCHTCDLVAKRDSGEAPPWDNIHRTPRWDVVHCNATSLLGWLVLVTRRHVAALDELTAEEALELGQLIRETSIILKALTGCAKTYVVQFAEAPGHHHVHFHIIPRATDLPPEARGPRIFQHLGVSPEDRLSDDVMNEFGQKVQQRLRDVLPQ